jgi:hypothetical protein
MNQFDDILQILKQFRGEKSWGKFHNTKDLV